MKKKATRDRVGRIKFLERVHGDMLAHGQLVKLADRQIAAERKAGRGKTA